MPETDAYTYTAAKQLIMFFLFVTTCTHVPAQPPVINSAVPKNGKAIYSITLSIIASYQVMVQHPAAGHSAIVQLVDINGKAVRTIKLVERSLKTIVNLKGLPFGRYNVVWRDGRRKQTKVITIID